MFELLGRVLCIAEIDEVEIRFPNVGTAEVGAAEIGLADLLGRTIGLLVELIAVEPGPASLAGDRAADQATAGRPEVESTFSQIGLAEVGPFPVDVGQAGGAEVGPGEIGPRHVRPGQQGTAKMGLLEIDVRKVDAFKIALDELRVREPRCGELGLVERQVVEAGAL